MSSLLIGLALIGTSVLSTGTAPARSVPLTADPLVASAPLDNPFEGSWSGAFVNLDTGEGGVLEWTIGEHGRLVGSYLWDDGSAGTFVGVVLASGVLHLAAPEGGGAFRGECTIDADGNMLVEAVDVDSGAPYAVELSPQ